MNGICSRRAELGWVSGLLTQIHRSLDPNVDMVWFADGIVRVAVLRVFIARAASINQMLHNRSVQHGQRHETKANRNPRNWFEVDPALMQQGKETMLHERNENDATDLAGNTISKCSRPLGHRNTETWRTRNSLPGNYSRRNTLRIVEKGSKNSPGSWQVTCRLACHSCAWKRPAISGCSASDRNMSKMQ
jgi:hypothetical protein